MRLLRMKPNSPGLMVAAFGYAGLPPSDGLIVSRLFGVSYLMVGGIGGLVRMVTTRQAGGSAFAGMLPYE
jgi:hypothetical protein